MLDEATIAKMKVAELKQELEDRQIEIPKGTFIFFNSLIFKTCFPLK